ncbi:MAG: two-component system, OmpR family, sensor kinase, partial [Solirubrobacteraceae bacterium]|nr:two-component system, OmpR family, sensor kinase [Solirubrobacteraceae bacterium]
LRADPDRLGQAVRNVLANALRHSRSTVTVHAEREGTRVRIAVDDDGPGVPEAEWEHVFDRFHRVAPRAGSKGAGLGLAIVRAVVEGSDGRVWMEASPDLGGARVCLELPAAAGPT